MLVDSVLKKDGNYYTEVFLKEFKYSEIVKKSDKTYC